MFAYVLALLGVLSRFLVVAHLPLLNFTAVGGSLIYFGARRSWREMFLPLGAFIAGDYYLTTGVYHYPFHWQAYVTTWLWYVAAMALGFILLRKRATFARGASAALLGPTSFFVVSNYGVWAGSVMYPHTLAGLGACYLAAVPFYRNDLLSTSIVLSVALGAPALAKRMNVVRARQTLAAK